MTQSLARKLWLAAGNRGLSSAVSMVTTIFIVRAFGPEAYALYTVDLAIIGLLLLVLELLPSNHAVFHVQDHVEDIRQVAAFALVMAVIVPLLVLMLFWAGLFHGYSHWALLYASSMSLSRYLDIRLQSTGRLVAFLQLDLHAAALRLAILALLVIAGVGAPMDQLWAALAIGGLAAQLLWLAQHSAEWTWFKLNGLVPALRALLAQKRQFIPYYLGSGLKRVRDNMVPVLATALLPDKASLGYFFLAYRGVIFANGQVRVLEGLVNHRATLAQTKRMGSRAISLLLLLSFATATFASVLLVLLSGQPDPPLTQIGLLSLTAPVSALMIFGRAKAYTRFAAGRVNASMATYIVVTLMGGGLLAWSGYSNGITLCLLLVAAEVASCAVLNLQKTRGL
jgi:hypothetical protein